MFNRAVCFGIGCVVIHLESSSYLVSLEGALPLQGKKAEMRIPQIVLIAYLGYVCVYGEMISC
jgi:hypothetical protein